MEKQLHQDRTHRPGTGILIALMIFTAAAIFSANAHAQSAQALKKQLTVERLYSSPSLGGSLTGGIEWSPDSKQLSYLHTSGHGKDAKTELWVMDAASGQSRTLLGADKMASLLPPPKTPAVQSTGLGRRPPQDYSWAPNGGALLFAGGGDLVWLDLKNMSSKSLLHSGTDVEDPKISPDGRWVSYVQNYNLWVLNIASGETRQLSAGGREELLEGKLDWVYPEELGSATAYWWSPDSSRLAYYEMDERPVTKYPIYNMSTDTGAVESTRFPQAGEPNPIVHVGVVAVTGGATRWMDTGNNTDVYLARVNWLPDSKQVAIQRLNRTQNHLDLLLGDSASGATRTIFSEDDKYWLNISDDLHFLSDGKRFLWTSERDSFRHIYLYDISGRMLEQLTSGKWPVEGVQGFGPQPSGLSVNEATGYVYFVSNKDDVTETNLYRLSLKDKSVTRITKENGTHAVQISPDTSAFVDTFSTAITPSRQDVARTDGTRIAVLNENKMPELAEYDLSPVEFLTVPAEDGTSLEAMMIKPPHFDPARKYPVLISIYGGPHAQVVRDAWGGGNALWHQMMAEKGYIVWSLDNRGSFARGHNFETPVYHDFGKVELADQIAGVNYLKSQPYVDGSRIGIWGWSYGGFMTVDALLRAPDVFKAGVAVAPVTDWKLYDTIYTERYMGTPKDNAEGYKDSSPANFAQNLKGKLMIAHGTGDDNVHFANSAELLNRFIEAGKYPELMIFPGRGHPISDRPARIELFNRITQFFLDNL